MRSALKCSLSQENTARVKGLCIAHQALVDIFLGNVSIESQSEQAQHLPCCVTTQVDFHVIRHHWSQKPVQVHHNVGLPQKAHGK